MNKAEFNHRMLVNDASYMMMKRRITHSNLAEKLGYSKSTVDKYFTGAKQTESVAIAIINFFGWEEEDYRWEIQKKK